MSNYNNQFSNYTVLDSKPIPSGAISKKFMSGVFMWMFVALGVSALVSYYFASDAGLQSLLSTQTTKGPQLTGLGIVVLLLPLAFTFIIQLGINRMAPAVLTTLLVLFSVAMGMSLSTVMLTYTSSSLLTCFLSSSVMFGVMALMGYTTDKDLTSFGSILSSALVGLVIASIINWALHSPVLYYLISYAGIAIFLGLTAYDVQKLKRIGAGIEYQGVAAGDVQKLTILGALELYLDFINLFLFMLRIFGNKRND